MLGVGGVLPNARLTIFSDRASETPSIPDLWTQYQLCGKNCGRTSTLWVTFSPLSTYNKGWWLWRQGAENARKLSVRQVIIHLGKHLRMPWAPHKPNHCLVRIQIKATTFWPPPPLPYSMSKQSRKRNLLGYLSAMLWLRSLPLPLSSQGSALSLFPFPFLLNILSVTFTEGQKSPNNSSAPGWNLLCCSPQSKLHRCPVNQRKNESSQLFGSPAS